jgi:hypothetical protein
MQLETDNTNSESAENGSAMGNLSPDLVNKVTERVWQMWKRDLRIEKERVKPSRHRFLRQGGN